MKTQPSVILRNQGSVQVDPSGSSQRPQNSAWRKDRGDGREEPYAGAVAVSEFTFMEKWKENTVIRCP
jgi:hypothetical protein